VIVDSVPLPVWVFIASLGLCLGSFASALIYRIPRGISWIWDSNSKENKACRSQCPQCGTTLKAIDLVPLFSWVLSKGRCRYCKAPISKLYPVAELATMCLTLALFAVWGLQSVTIPLLLMAPFLVSLIAIDWEHMIIPDDINISLGVLSCLYSLLAVFGSFQGQWWHTAFPLILGAVLLPLVFYGVSVLLEMWKKKKALGMGDIKFLIPVGLCIGVQAIPSFMLLGGVFGVVTAFLWFIKGKDGAFPFGPALAFSFILHVFLTGLGFDY
jgi:leader peptidase (prepilin peptidase) / N-methyltransferase